MANATSIGAVWLLLARLADAGVHPGDIRHSQADITRGQADLGYCPCTDLDQSLRRCIKHLQARQRETLSQRQAVCHLG